MSLIRTPNTGHPVLGVHIRLRDPIASAGLGHSADRRSSAHAGESRAAGSLRIDSLKSGALFRAALARCAARLPDGVSVMERVVLRYG